MLRKFKRVNPLAFRLGKIFYWRAFINPLFFSSSYRFMKLFQTALLGWGNFFQFFIHKFYAIRSSGALLLYIYYTMAYRARYRIKLKALKQSKKKKTAKQKARFIRKLRSKILIMDRLLHKYLLGTGRLKRAASSNLGSRPKVFFKRYFQHIKLKLLIEELFFLIWPVGCVFIYCQHLFSGYTPFFIKQVATQTRRVYIWLPWKKRKFKFLMDCVLYSTLSFFWFNSEIFMLFLAQEVAKTRKQMQFFQLMANMLAYNRYFFKKRYCGLHLLVKGKIGRHGRTKTYYFKDGIFLQQIMVLPVNFFFVTTATYYGALGIRLWLVAQVRLPRQTIGVLKVGV